MQEFRACPPPSVMVEGTCCSPEAVESGVCKPFRLSECTGGKVRRGEFCVCPQGTSENRRTGACDKPRPTVTKKKDCKPGFERRGSRCVRSGGTITEGGQRGPAKGTRSSSGSGGETVNKPAGRSSVIGGSGLLEPSSGFGAGQPSVSGGGAPASGGGGAPRSGGFRPR